MRNGFVFMASYYNAMTYIPEPDRSKLIEAVLRYGLFDEEPNLPDNLMGFWMLIEPTLRTSVKKYDRNAERKRKSKADSTSEPLSVPKTEGGDLYGEPVGDSAGVNFGDNFGAGKDKEKDMDMEMDTRPAGPDSRSRPCKDMDKESSLTTSIDIEAEENWEKIETTKNEKLSLSRFKPPEDLSGYTEEELEEERQKKLQAIQKFKEEAKK